MRFLPIEVLESFLEKSIDDKWQVYLFIFWGEMIAIASQEMILFQRHTRKIMTIDVTIASSRVVLGLRLQRRETFFKIFNQSRSS